MRRIFWLLTLASLVFSAPVLAAGVSVHDATPAQLKSAQKSFEQGNELFDAGKYEEAAAAFRASYDVVASPNSRLMVARALRELGRLDEAYAEFEGALADAKAAATKDAKKYGKTVAAVDAELGGLQKRVARVKVELAGAPAGTTVRVGDRTVHQAALARPLVLAPGTTVITARGPGGETAEQRLELAAGTEQSVRLELEARPPEASPAGLPGEQPPAPGEGTAGQQASFTTDGGGVPLRTLGLVVGGIGVLGLATFAVFGSMNNSKFDELESECQPDGRCAADRQDDIDSGRTYQTVANVGLIVGGVGVLAGATLFVLGGGSEQANAKPVQIAVLPGRVSVGGRF